MDAEPQGPARPADPEKMRQGIRLFLEGLGVDLSDPELAETPERVSEAWSEELADGYRVDPAEALGPPIPSQAPEPIFALGLRFVSLCPHHLLPYEGQAHLVYVPGASIVGLGRLPRLVDAFAHRLVLQEALTTHIARALIEHLGAQGAGCVLVGRHGCMAHRGPRQTEARIVTTAWEGALRGRADLQGVLLAEASRSGRLAP